MASLRMINVMLIPPHFNCQLTTDKICNYMKWKTKNNLHGISCNLSAAFTTRWFLLSDRHIMLSFRRLTNHLFQRAVLIAQTSMVLGLWEKLNTLFRAGFCIVSDHE